MRDGKPLLSCWLRGIPSHLWPCLCTSAMWPPPPLARNATSALECPYAQTPVPEPDSLIAKEIAPKQLTSWKEKQSCKHRSFSDAKRKTPRSQLQWNPANFQSPHLHYKSLHRLGHVKKLYVSGRQVSSKSLPVPGFLAIAWLKSEQTLAPPNSRLKKGCLLRSCIPVIERWGIWSINSSFNQTRNVHGCEINDWMSKAGAIWLSSWYASRLPRV